MEDSCVDLYPPLVYMYQRDNSATEVELSCYIPDCCTKYKPTMSPTVGVNVMAAEQADWL
jgi:hypothetical protein